MPKLRSHSFTAWAGVTSGSLEWRLSTCVLFGVGGVWVVAGEVVVVGAVRWLLLLEHSCVLLLL